MTGRRKVAMDKGSFRTRFGNCSKTGLMVGVVLLAIALVAMGCTTLPPKYASTPHAAPVAKPAPRAPGAPVKAAKMALEPIPATGEPQVVLQPYDVIKVKFLYWPELDDEQTIRPDGKISLLMVGEIEAQGVTPEQLRQKLLALYESKINNPDINVVVTTLASNRVYVGGEVATPGLIIIDGKLTALGAIIQAGGFKERSAKKSCVVVIRHRDGKQYARTLDLRTALEHPETDTFYLEPYDVIYVPRTNIDKVDQFVDQYLNSVVPRWVSTGFNWDQTVYGKGKSSGKGTSGSPVTLTLTP